MKSKRGIVLPTVVVTMMVISIMSLLLLTFITSSNLNNNLLAKRSAQKLELEQIFSDFKNNNSNTYENYTIYYYDAYDSESNVLNLNIKGLVAKKDDTVILIAIYDFNNENVIAYKTNNIDITINDDGSFVYGNYNFTTTNYQGDA